MAEPTPLSPASPTAAVSGLVANASLQASDLSVFLLEGPRLPPPSQAERSEQMPPGGATPDTMSITKAWQSFIMPSTTAQAPPRKRFCDRTAVPASSLADEMISVRFRHPTWAVPPPRLAAFALPAQLPELFDCPRDVCFCLTQADGTRLHGSALQLCDTDDDGQLVLRSLVLISKFPVFELWHTMLHTIYSRRDDLWPASAPLSPSGRCRFPSGTSATAAPMSVTAAPMSAAAAPMTVSPPAEAVPAMHSPTLSSLLDRTADVLRHGEQVCSHRNLPPSTTISLCACT